MFFYYNVTMDKITNEQEILHNLNLSQVRAVKTTEGPVLVLAAAGSGKTAVVTRRIAYILYKGYAKPEEILAITFTNKAAKEMKERISKMVGEEIASRMFVQTFHSFAVRILRRHAHEIGYKNSFTIYDEQDSNKLIKTVLEELNIKVKEDSTIVKKVRAAISSNKNGNKKINEQYEDIVEHYNNKLISFNAMDFDDLLNNLMVLLKTNKSVREFYQNKFKYIHVDEFQDVNSIQAQLVDMLCGFRRNIMVVGDDFQCVVEGQKVMTPNGDIPIEKINVGDLVYALKQGKPFPQKVTNKSKSIHDSFLQITTDSGKIIKVTKEHAMLAKMGTHNGWYTYLMYRPDLGFRLGITKNNVLTGKNNPTRPQSERAERMWLLEWFPNRSAAQFLEQQLSLKYQVPTISFKIRENMTINQKEQHQIFKEFGSNGIKILNVYHQKFQNPIYFAQGCSTAEDRVVVNLIMGTKIGAEVNVETSNKIADRASNLPWTSSKAGKRIRRYFKSFKEAKMFAEKVSSLIDGTVVEKFSYAKHKGSLKVLPASAIVHGVLIPVQHNDSTVLESVISIKEIKKEVTCYDLEVENRANFCVNGIYVHNSIYGFRNADITNILNFEKTYPDAVTIKLEQNYRSTGNIIAAASSVIEHNLNQKQKSIFTHAAGGENIVITKLCNHYQEAEFIAKEIKKLLLSGEVMPKDIAVFYRNNIQNEALDKAFSLENFPYKIVSGLRFWDREEIRDIRAYLQLLVNINDEISMKRIINKPKRALGKTTVKKIDDYAVENNISFSKALLKIVNSGNKTFSEKQRKSIEDFLLLLKEMRSIEGDIEYIVKMVIKMSGIRAQIEKGKQENYINKLNNIDHFIDKAREAKMANPTMTLLEFMEETVLSSDIDGVDDSDNFVSLMTVHTSKGLEFPVVFISGLEESIFPSLRSSENEKDLEEERRLFYVALTRAEKKLYLTFADERRMYGQSQRNRPSRFIKEIPSEYLQMNNFSNKMNNNAVGSYQRNTKYNSVERVKSSPNPNLRKKNISHLSQNKNSIRKGKSAEIVLGDVVSHPTFGIGIVKRINGDKVTVFFDSYGRKEILEQYLDLK